MEDVEVGLSDYINPLFIVDFKKTWEDQTKANEVIETFSLTSITSIKSAVSTIIGLLGIEVCENSNNVKDKASTHCLMMAGTFIGGFVCLVRCRMAFEANSGVTLEICVRGSDKIANEKIANCIS